MCPSLFWVLVVFTNFHMELGIQGGEGKENESKWRNVLTALQGMAEGISTTQNLLTCPICLDILKDPVTLHCGHNYCMECIKCYWDQVQKKVYRCPQCRQRFTPRPPVLNRNNVFSELVEQFRKTKIQAVASSIAEPWARPEEVVCNLCIDRKVKAVKSCLDCLLSYCETHFKAHNDVNPGRKHKVVNAADQLGLQERICTKHLKPLEVFCRTDQSCVCLLCLVDDEHKGHDTVLASVGKMEKQAEARRSLQQREKTLKHLRKAVETLKSSAQTAVEDSEKIFTEMIRSIERRRSEVTALIRAQEKAEVRRAEGLLKQLEQEIADLKKRDAELEQLSQTDDHIHFLKSFQLVRDLPEYKDQLTPYTNQSFSFESVKKLVSTLKDQLENDLKGGIIKISAAVTNVQAVLSQEFSTRDKFLQYSWRFTLDPNTANRTLHLSEGNRRVDSRAKGLSHPFHPERFDGWFQVLCTQGVPGRSYWEVEWNGEVAFAVSSKHIPRNGSSNVSRFGFNDLSWSLRLFNSNFSFWHNNIETKLPLVASSRIGVYVDHKAGILAFYNICDTMTLLHRVQTTFIDTLYPGFGVGTGSSVKFL